jgi:hypothetical protein
VCVFSGLAGVFGGRWGWVRTQQSSTTALCSWPACKKTPPDPDLDQFQDFIRAGIVDLKRHAGDDPTVLGTGSQLPLVPPASQLSMFLLLITKGVEPKHQDVFTHRDRLTEYLDTLSSLYVAVINMFLPRACA